MAVVKISSVEGNRQRLDGGAMFGNAPRVVWEKWAPPDALGRIELACRGMLIESGSHRILCETGIGSFFDPKLKERYGVIESSHRLLASLTALEVEPDDITAVVLSHLHFDHAGGLLPSFDEIQAGNDKPLFNNAHYYVGAAAWQRALHPHPRDRASFIPGLTDKLLSTGRLKLIPDETTDQYFDGLISFRFTSGHTPGQLHTVVHGTEKRVIFAGDLIPGTAWVHAPISMGYDRFPELVIDEKQDLYQTITSDEWFVFFTHDPTIAAAQIHHENGKYSARNPVQTPMVRMVV
jgi:glyoxylase-like metal-dependent hydrolase (beta-lactamase superfamily II)